MATIIQQPDPEEEPDSPSDESPGAPSSEASSSDSSSDIPTGQYSPFDIPAVDVTPAEPMPRPDAYPLPPEEPLPAEARPVEPAHSTSSYAPPPEPFAPGAGARAYSPPPSQAAYTPPYTPPYSYTGRALKDRTLALVAEILPGIFGFLGIGWIYSGNTTAGILTLIGFLGWNFIALILDALTVGLFLCLHLPANLIAVAVSSFLLYNYTKKHTELFGA